MTRKEVIDELQKIIDLIKQNGKDWLDERDIPILQMAITALELSDSIMLQLDCKMFHSGVDVESTISEATPSVQFAKDTNVLNNDSISRQDTIDIILSVARGESDVRTVVDNAINSIKKMPSAQPDAPDTNVGDMISRQAAIDMIVGNKYSLEYCKEHHIDFAIDVGLAIAKLSDMPSVQPEPTYEQIQEYCHKRGLSIVDGALLRKYMRAYLCNTCTHWRFKNSRYEDWQCESCCMSHPSYYERRTDD